MKIRFSCVVASVLLIALSACAAEESPAAPAASDEAKAQAAPLALENEVDRLNYAIGVQMGKSLKASKFELKLPVLTRAIEDVIAERPMALSDEELKKIMDDFRQKMMAERQKMMEEQQKQQQEQGVKNLEQGKAFLEANKTKEGVITLADGLQYKVNAEGAGESPKDTDQVRVHYKGTLLDGTEFDSSYTRGEPAVFGVTQVIKGWTEALKMMKPGAKWTLYVPPDLAYGDQQRGPIPPSSVLIFEVELIEIVK